MLLGAASAAVIISTVATWQSAKLQVEKLGTTGIVKVSGDVDTVIQFARDLQTEVFPAWQEYAIALWLQDTCERLIRKDGYVMYCPGNNQAAFDKSIAPYLV
jgi:hypothetical protein